MSTPPSVATGPSPTARALRLAGLRADDPAALRAALATLPPPPWDAEVLEGDPLGALLAAEGFVPYARTVVMARPIAGLPSAPFVPACEVEEYRNTLAEPFAELEGRAMADLASFAQMGQPTGYEQAEGFDIFLVAMEGERPIGFIQVATPEGWINWMGVDPDRRRSGVGHLLMAAAARRLAEDRATHLVAQVEVDGPAPAFLAALGFQRRGPQRTLVIRTA